MPHAQHIAVLEREALGALCLRRDSVVVDATYGRGGHTRGILAQLGAQARLLVIDRDGDAIAHARQHLPAQVDIVHTAFSQLAAVLRQQGLFGQVTAILFDLGVCSSQLAAAARGFSFDRDGPLDMRMDQSRGLSAAEWLQTLDAEALRRVLKTFGEERFARRVARRIVEFLAAQPSATTRQLATVVAQAVPRVPAKHSAKHSAKHPGKHPTKHPATRTFQAIRIAVNRELDELDAVLPQAVDALAGGGRLVVISFHSLEDRRVKRFLRAQSRGDAYPPDFPVQHAQLKPRLRIVAKARKASPAEVLRNPRARSAVMRVAEKLA